jgi:restriction system protein
MRGKGTQFARFLWPVIEALQKLGGSGKANEVKEIIFEKFNITKDAVTSTGVPRFYNQIAWARLYLVKSGYLDSSKRGVWNLTKKGRKAAGFSDEKAQEIFKEVQNEYRAGSPRKKSKGGSFQQITDKFPEVNEVAIAAEGGY